MLIDQLVSRPVAQVASHGIPEALHIDTQNRPFAKNFGAPGVSLQLLHADIEANTFAVRLRLAPGVQLPPHHHSGVVYAYTLAGRWYYQEYKDSSPHNVAGSYLYEPPGSIHTLTIAEENEEETDVIFIITGAMLILDNDRKVIQVLDAASHINDWAEALRAQGDAVPPLIGGARTGFINI